MKLLFAVALAVLTAMLPAHAQNTLSLSEGQVSPRASIQEVSWIAGHWRGEAFGGITEEIWSPPLGNSMMCVFRLVNDDITSFYEIETISEVNETLILRLKHFHADLKGWEEKNVTVDFPLVKLEPHKAYFDGLTFEKISEDEMNVYVVMQDDDGSENEMKFPYRLVK
jgi:hypothetical protein